MKLGEVRGFDLIVEAVEKERHQSKFVDYSPNAIPTRESVSSSLYRWYVPTGSRGYFVYQGGKKLAYRGRLMKSKKPVSKVFRHKGTKKVRCRRFKSNV